MHITRRDALKGALGTTVLAGLGATQPFHSTAARAAETKSIKIASMGPITGNWDPTSHTTIGQLNVEFVDFRTPHQLPDERR